MDTSQALRRCGDRIESWDDDPDFADLDLKLTHTSTSSPKSPKNNMRSNFENHGRDRRESISSRMSVQSSTYDFESPDGWDERQVLLDDSPATAIASAINAGIPIPENVPSSALIGGTIKRLGTKKAKRIAAHDDWGEDLELPMSGMALKVREQERHEFPDSLQQILAGSRSRNTSPSRGTLAPVLTASSQLNKFREIPEDDDFFGGSDDLPMLKVSPVRHVLRQQRSTASLLMTPPLSESATRGSPSIDDDFENDFEFPADAPLQLNIKLGDNTRGPLVHGLDNDFEEWAEGSSLGTRFGGTGRERGMSVGTMSIVSASVSSVTAESEDEAPLDGLELPTGPLPNFREILEKRKRTSFSADTEMIDAPPTMKSKPSKEDFLEGIEIGDGEVFDARKLTLNRNVKHKQPTRKTSPVRRSAMSLTFTTNKAQPNNLSSGIGGAGNRLRHGHPTLAPPIPILEPVVERERENQNPIVNKRPEQRSRWSNNSGTADRWSAKSEAIPANVPPPPPIPHSRFFADRQRQMGSKQSLRTLKAPKQQENTAPTTTNAQLLRMKRSMPNIGRAAASPSKPNSTVRSPSRNSGGRPASRSSAGRPPSSTGGRPPSSAGGRSTTTTAGRNEPGRSKTSGERKQAPFLPAGGTVRQSHHIAAKISQQTFEYKEKIAAERRANSRHQQRTPHHSPSSSTASTRTKRGTPTIAPEPLRRQAAAIETLKQPTRKRNFGDGTELEIFDDLPTSAKAENRFVVTPVGRGAPKAKSQSVPIRGTADRDGESPKKKIDLSRDLSSRFAEVPRFARDTNASRNAREQRMGITNTGTGYTGINQWKQQVAARNNVSPKSRRKPQLKPQLIKPMGNISNPPKAAAAVNGMTYNPKTFRWEGNENEVRGFEAEKIPTPPRPALISNVNHSGSKLGIQVVGGMVFDPASMSWLKVDEDPDEDEHDPFEGFDDLMDQDMLSIDGYSGGGADSGIGPIFSGRSAEGSRSGRLSGGFGEFVVGEEFDVGPEFVRRQREEEDRWRKKVDGWISTGEATKIENRWAIRELLAEHQ